METRRYKDPFLGEITLRKVAERRNDQLATIIWQGPSMTVFIENIPHLSPNPSMIVLGDWEVETIMHDLDFSELPSGIS